MLLLINLKNKMTEIQNHIRSFYSKKENDQNFLFTMLHDRVEIIDYIKYKKSLGTYNVIDLGASASSWSYEVIDAVIDIRGIADKKCFIMDVQDQDQWGEILDYVDKNGKFDLSICSHTIEDLHYPQAALKLLQRISNAGYITVPSANAELVYRGQGAGKGYDHHLWIFHPHEKKLLMMPKMNHIEHTDYELDLSNDFSAEGLQKAIKKVLKNLDKDQIYYTNLKASLSTKINKKQIEAAKQVEVKKDNHTDDFNQLKTLVKNQLANTKINLGKKEKATSVHPKGVKLMKEAEEEKFDLNKYNKDLFKKQSKEFTAKLTKPVTQKNTLKDKIKEYITKQLKKEAIGFTVGGKEQFVKNADAPGFEQTLKTTGVKYTKRTVQ
jgi:hypothetical protein